MFYSLKNTFIYTDFTVKSSIASVVLSYFIGPLDGSVVSSSTPEYFITEFSACVCSFLFRETYFDSGERLHFRVFGYCVCVCQAANPGMISRYVCVCTCACGRLRVSITVTHQADDADHCPVQLLMFHSDRVHISRYARRLKRGNDTGNDLNVLLEIMKVVTH